VKDGVERYEVRPGSVRSVREQRRAWVHRAAAARMRRKRYSRITYGEIGQIAGVSGQTVRVWIDRHDRETADLVALHQPKEICPHPLTVPRPM